MPTVSYDPATRQTLGVQRPLLAVYQDLAALSAAQKNAVWADFTSGSPPKWSLADGPMAGAVMACSVAAVDLTLAAIDQQKARLKMVAAYVVDHPLYLVRPAFDPTIDVPGHQ